MVATHCQFVEWSHDVRLWMDDFYDRFLDILVILAFVYSLFFGLIQMNLEVHKIFIGCSLFLELSDFQWEFTIHSKMRTNLTSLKIFSNYNLDTCCESKCCVCFSKWVILFMGIKMFDLILANLVISSIKNRIAAFSH